MPPVIAVMNCNTTASMTARIAAAAGAAVPGVEILPLQPEWGVPSAESWYDSYLSAAAVLDRLSRPIEPFDALVMAGFGEHGREGARELLAVPVVDITEAGAMQAMLIGHRYGVVTTPERTCPQIEDSLRTAGLLQRCASIVGADVSVLEIAGAAGEETAEAAQAEVAALLAAGRRALAAGADVLVLGCAGTAGFEGPLSRELGVPVIEPVAAGVVLAHGLVTLGLRTSKAGPLAAPPVKGRIPRG